MKIIVLIIVVVSIYLLISVATIIKNGVSLGAAPGFIERFKIFMTTHEAETRSNHSFPELESQTYSIPADTLMEKIKTNAETLNWKIQSNDNLTAHFIITTELLKFKDDISVTLTPIDKNKTLLNLRSESRVGRADFGANLGHILKLKRLLKN